MPGACALPNIIMKKSLFNKKLTLSESAAMFWYVFEGEMDWKKVFAAAAGWEKEEMEEDPLTLGQYVS